MLVKERQAAVDAAKKLSGSPFTTAKAKATATADVAATEKKGADAKATADHGLPLTETRCVHLRCQS